MPQSSEDSSTTVHGYQSISQPAPLPDPGSQTQPKHPPLAPLLPTLALGPAALSSSAPQGWILLTTPSGQASLCCSPRCSHPAPGITEGSSWVSQAGLWSLSLQPDTACPKPPKNATTLLSCHSPGRERGQQGQPPTLLPAEHYMLNTRGWKAHTALSLVWALLPTSANSPEPSPQP